MNKLLPKARTQNIVTQELEAEILIYDLEINKAFCLNSTAAMVWKHCHGKSTFAEVIDDFNENFKQRITEDFVWLTLESLKKENLLMNGDEVKPRFNGMSRREVVRKVGLASMVALPLISSIVAPSAVQAQSGNPPSPPPLVCTPGLCMNLADCQLQNFNCPAGPWDPACTATGCCCCTNLATFENICA